MYLLPTGQGARSTTKWGLSGPRFGTPLFGAWSGKPRGLRAWSGKPRNLRGLGDSTAYDIEGNPINNTGQVVVLDSGVYLPGQNIPTAIFDTPNTQTPQQPGVAPSSSQSIQNAYQQLTQSATVSQNPLDYVSPQAAIAAGVPAQSAYNAWSAAMAKFPTQQAALAAGIPAGVVTQLWAQSRSAAPIAAAGTTFGVSNTVLLFGAAGIALVALMRGRH